MSWREKTQESIYHHKKFMAVAVVTRHRSFCLLFHMNGLLHIKTRFLYLTFCAYLCKLMYSVYLESWCSVYLESWCSVYLESWCSVYLESWCSVYLESWCSVSRILVQCI